MANFDLALSFAPKTYSAQIPKMPPTMRPPRIEIPRPIPRLTYSGCAKMIEPAASADRQRSLAAKSEAAYCGYVSGRYMKTHWNNTNAPIQYSVMPMIPTIQCISDRAVQPNQNKPAGMQRTANKAGTRRCSWARRPFFIMSGSR